MRRLTPKERAALARLNLRRETKRLVRRRRLKERAFSLQTRAYEHAVLAAGLNLVPPRDLTRIPIVLPEKLSLRSNYDATVGAIAELRKSVLTRNAPVMLYFDAVKELEPAAALMLAAEIFRCKNLRSWRRGLIVNGNYPDDSDAFLQLRDLGFYKLIEVDEHISIPDGRDRQGRPFFIPFRTFKGVNPQFAAEFCDLTVKGAFEIGQLAQGRMVGALKEAMGNAEEHAYSAAAEYPVMSGRWWVTGYVNPTDHEMMVTFFDQGIGIPKRLTAELFDFIKSAISRRAWSLSDGYMIAAATELHRTSTGLAGRGKGFRDMKKFVDTCDDGELRVLSNGGSYCYTNKEENISDSKLSIGGTLIEWRIRHAAKLEVI